MFPQIRTLETGQISISLCRSLSNKRKWASAFSISLASLALFSANPEAHGQNIATLVTLHTFTGAGDGGIPSADLAQDAAGNLYGTTIGIIITFSGTGAGTSSFTSSNYGTIFKITPAGASSVIDTLFTFDLLANGVPLNGTSPRGGLVAGGDPSILYGTTSGVVEQDTLTFDTTLDEYTSAFTETTVGDGTVFKFDTRSNALTTLATFGASTGGLAPVGTLVLGTDGPLYGVTSGGTAFVPDGSGITAATATGEGSVFSITSTGTLTTLGELVGGTAGTAPFSGLVEGGDGNYYGTTSSGGSTTISGFTINNEGTIFQLTRGGILTTIYTFDGGADGGVPAAALALPKLRNGYLYGTTTTGGTGYGTVFKIDTAGQLTTIHTFAGGSLDGGVPAAKLLAGSDGNFYGSTSGYTTLNLDGSLRTYHGTIFQISPDATLDTGFTTLYNFDTGDGINGSTPLGSLIEGSDGTLYGTTSAGGGNEFGSVFELTVPGLTGLPSFFNQEVSVGNGVYYLALPNKGYFGYYSVLAAPDYIYHFDLGYEYVIDANDANSGVYLYDFASGHFFYTSPSFGFPYLYDFTLDSILYYYPSEGKAFHYTSDPRYFYDFATSQIISM